MSFFKVAGPLGKEDQVNRDMRSLFDKDVDPDAKEKLRHKENRESRLDKTDIGIDYE